jgi:hypothetical protein
MVDGETYIKDCTVPEIIEHLSKRVPALAIGVLAPEDGQVCSTLTLSSGNRAACLGLAELLKARTLQDLLGQQQNMEDVGQEENEDDEPPHRTHG